MVATEPIKTMPIRNQNQLVLNPYRIVSYFMMGGTQFLSKYYLYGLYFCVPQLLFLFNLSRIAEKLSGLRTLGEIAQKRKGFQILQGDNSVNMLVEGVICVILLGLLLWLYYLNIQQAKYLAINSRSLKQQMFDFYDKHFAFIALSPAGIAVLFFIIMPIGITVMVAFTNYAAPNHIPPKNLVDWVGFDNFINLFKMNIWADTLLGVGLWTILWALFSSMTVFVFGFMLAIAIEKRGIRFKRFWRMIFILPYAIPAFVSLLVFRLLLNGIGPVNNVLNDIGISAMPFLTDPLYAKLTVIVINVWVGAPYFMLLISSCLTNISRDLYEASEVDGATPWDQFKEITLPMVLYQVAPSLVMTFAHNFNNFGAIYLLTGGGPNNSNYRYAGDTDILITWIYKLTLDFQQYNIAAVVSLLIFLFLSLIAIWQFSRMKSFKTDVGM